MNRSAGKAKRAFSIIEALLAFVVLLLALTGLITVGVVSSGGRATGTGAAPFAFGNIKTNSIQVQAVGVAQQYMDQLRDAIRTPGTPLPTPPPNVPISAGQFFINGSTAAAAPGNFVITNPGSCPNVSTSALLRSCTVQVGAQSDTGVKILNVPIVIVSYAAQQAP